MTTTWELIGAVPATECNPHLTTDGVTAPQVEVAITGTDRLHVHLAMLGPEGDVPEARMTPSQARQVAAALSAAADAVEPAS